jgi:hypothetical protein
MQFINACIYWHEKGFISDCLNRLLQDVLDCAPAVVLIIFFCIVKIVPLLKGLPQKIIPYFITE